MVGLRVRVGTVAGVVNRVVGHHTEIAGITGWYTTMRNQAQDLFTHRHAVWPST